MRKFIPAISRVVLALCLCTVAVTGQNPSPSAAKTVVFLGDSLAAGLGDEPKEAFPALIAEKVHSLGQSIEVVNAGLSGDTSAGGLRRVEGLLQQRIDVLVLELGGNDGLRGLPVKSLQANLQAIIDKTKANNPAAKIVIAGMQIPPNLGPDYARDFQRAYADLAHDNHATLIPFLLEGVGGHRELNQPDSIHPTAAGHRIIADVVWRFLEPLLKEG